MRKVNSVVIGALMIFAVAVMSSTAARAGLIEQDLNVAGDKLITLDTDTGYQWLDVTATLGLSYNQAEATAFVTAQGFRHATVDEVSQLYADAGVVDQSGLFNGANTAGIQELMNKLGCVGQCGTTFPYQEGWADIVPFSSTVVMEPFVQLRTDTNEGAVGCVDPATPVTSCFRTKDTVIGPRGNYLVRVASVPEPANFALFALGLAGAGAMRRKRREG